MNTDNALAALWMLHCVPVWSKVLCKMLRVYGSPLAAYEACCHAKPDEQWFTPEEQQLFADTDVTAAKETLDYCKKSGINIITFGDKEYPFFLDNIPTPPVCLFVKGTMPDTALRPSITIVGTRDCSERGKKLTAKMAYDLSSQGFVVVSGLARGIDTYAHKGCLLANASPTVAVLAGSVEDVYPKENKDLYDLILKNGAVISETMPKTAISKYAFHQRNRILSGLTLGTVVVESGTKGGSMITATHALDQNRTVFAVPGEPGAERSEGTNMLIKQGAVLCSNINDILTEYQLVFKDLIKPVDIQSEHKRAVKIKTAKQKDEQNRVSSLSDEEKAVYEALADGGLAADGLCEKTLLPFPTLIAILQTLELSDLIEQIPGGVYIQKHI